MKQLNLRHLITVIVIAILCAMALLLALPMSVGAAYDPSIPRESSALAVPHCVYVVRYGDTLSRIARQYNTTLGMLMQMNGLDNPNWIFAGMLLRVPCGAPSPVCYYYIVRPGDYLKSIAVRYGVSWQSIAAINHLLYPNRIYPGMRLGIPCVSTQ